MTFAIEFTKSAKKDMAALGRDVLRQVDKKILALALNPRPRGTEKLKGADNLWRIRVGDYRVIYSVEEGRLLVLVIRIAHRREVYRGY